MQTPGAIIGVDRNERGLVLRLENAVAHVYVISSQVIRLRLSFSKHIVERNYAFQMTAWPDLSDDLFPERIKTPKVDFAFTRNEHELSLATSELRLVIQVNNWQLCVYDKSGQTLFEDLPKRSLWLDSNSRLNHAFRRFDSDQWFGLGEKTGPLDRSGRRYRMESCDAVGYDPVSADPLYKHVPLLIRAQQTGRFIGLFYNNAWPSEFDIGCARSGYWGAFGSARFDGGDFDLSFIVGDELPEIVRAYTKLTGAPVMMPRYSLGYLGSTMYYTELATRSDLAVQGFIDKCHREGIPVSGFHLSSGYTSGEDGKRYVFQWNNQRFPNPDGFVTSFNEQGLSLSPNIKPALLSSHSQFSHFSQAQAFVRNADSNADHLERFWGGMAAMVDFSSEKGRTAWKQGLREALIDKGITSIWNDNNEFEFADTSAIAAGDGLEESVNGLRPLLSNRMAKVAYDSVKEAHPNTRPFILSRAGFSGCQQWVHTWSGDNGSSWEYFRSNLTTMLGLSLSGFAFNGMDLGGFTGPAPEPELLVRWLQNGVFHPRFCIHSANDDNTVTEPWMHQSVKPLVVAAMQQRYRLLPYLYQQVRRAHMQGEPVVTPMLYHFWNDSELHSEQFDFMLGDACMVASVVEAGQRTKQQYFAAGEQFIDCSSGKRFVGGRSYQIETPLERNAWFLRSGYWMVQSRDPFKAEALTFSADLVPSHFSFYWDDGHSFEYLQGQMMQLDFELSYLQQQVKLEWQTQGFYKLSDEPLEFEFFSQLGCPMELWLGSTCLPLVLYEEDWSETEEGYRYEAERCCLVIKLQHWRMDQSGELYMNFNNRIAISI